jgi:nuclear transport factor 2 (NTF2) superfamily protein
MKATEVTRRYHDAWNDRDADALVAAFTKDGPFATRTPIPALAERLLPHT